MSTDPWPAGFGRVVLDEVDSTMAEAARRAPDLTQPTWIMAHQQTAGKGRRGRAWHMPQGNFAATLVLPNPGTPLQAAQRSFVAAIALRRAFCAWAEPDLPELDAKRATLKWPNDVLLDGRKAAGILLEAAGQGGQPSHVAIGIGVNLVAAPPSEALEPNAVLPIALAEVTPPPSPEDALTTLAAAYAEEETWFRDMGFATTRTRWLNHAARLGQPIIARTGSAEHRGIFDTIDDEGSLVLLTPGGRQAIPAADVYF